MKSHFCKAEKEELMFEGQCNWCGEKEGLLREEALKLAEDISEYAPDTNIEIMIRRLVAEIDRLNDEDKFDMDGRC